MLQLSLSYDKASLEVGERFKLTNSEAQDVDVSGPQAHLSFVDLLASSLRPAPGGASPRGEGREVRKWYTLEWDASAFTRGNDLPRNLQTLFG